MRIKNNCKSPLGIPDNPLLDPGQEIFCLNWDLVKENQIVKSWVKRRMLIVDEPVASDPVKIVDEIKEADPVAQTGRSYQDELIDELATYGVNRDRRTGIAKLEKLLAEAKA